MFFNRGPEIVGRWNGYRPTNYYVWEVRYECEFLRDGRYRYSARQVSALRPLWSLNIQGRYKVMGSDSTRWEAILELTPADARGSVSREDRVALVDVLGLPDDRQRRFRFRKQPMTGALCFQLSDGNPKDEVDRGWYLQRA